jgi:hypothetical protein
MTIERSQRIATAYFAFLLLPYIAGYGAFTGLLRLEAPRGLAIGGGLVAGIGLAALFLRVYLVRKRAHLKPRAWPKT